MSEVVGYIFPVIVPFNIIDVALFVVIMPVIVPPVVGSAVDEIIKSVAVDVDVEIPVPATLTDFTVYAGVFDVFIRVLPVPTFEIDMGADCVKITFEKV